MIALIMITGVSCDRFPRDPDHTLEKVQNSNLPVGITENPPYVIFGKDGPSGKEIEMIKSFAQSLNAEVEWVKGCEEEIMTMLKEGQVNLCAGGFNTKSVWKKHVYFTTPHDTIIYRWGTPRNTPLPDDLNGERVYIKRGSPAGAYVHHKGGQPIYLDSLKGSESLIAAPERILRRWGYSISENKIKEEKISLAAQKGENAFVEKLEKFLTQYEKESRE